MAGLQAARQLHPAIGFGCQIMCNVRHISPPTLFVAPAQAIAYLAGHSFSKDVMGITLVSAQQASKKFSPACAGHLAHGVSTLHHMGNIFQYMDIGKRGAIHRHKIGKAPGCDAA